ncbi:MAG: CHAD domain-containing protein [Pyrinomonadaceae bacterium]
MARAAKIENLNCQANAADGAQLVIETRFAEMWTLRAGALEWADPEGVHGMRVASRRLRSALEDFRAHLPQLHLKKLQKNARTIAAALGRVRDLDVGIDALEALRDEAAPEVKAGIEQIVGDRKLKRESYREELRLAIGPEAAQQSHQRFARVREKWPTAMDQSSSSASFADVGREVIIKRSEDLRRLGASLYRPFETSPLHEMRIMAKRLRYAVELFSPCWPQALEASMEAIARLQADLGDLHDCDEWISEFGRELRYRQRFSAEWSEAAAWLLATFTKKRGKSYTASLMLWEEWQRRGFFADLTAIISSAVNRQTDEVAVSVE